jgi:hypothetical protein
MSLSSFIKNSFLKNVNKKVKQADRLIAAANLPALYKEHSNEIGDCVEKIKKV